MIELPVINKPVQKKEFRLSRGYPDLQNDPSVRDLAKDEFMPGASDPPGGASRRQFLQLMGASLAMAGLSACRRPEVQSLPYSQSPEEIIPGVPLFYATAMPFRGVLRGLLVESHDGRPTKVEGNPEHPISQGVTTIFEQASPMRLYDPDRSKQVLRNNSPSTWQEFVDFSRTLIARASTLRIAVVSEPNSSPSMASLRQQLAQRFPLLRWVEFTPEGDDPVKLGMQMAYGQPLRPLYRFSESSVIVSLDADFLGPTETGLIPHAREFARTRRPETGVEMSRLYVVESSFSPTGAKADHRLPIRASQIPAVAAALAARLGMEAGPASQEFADHPFVVAMAEDLLAAGNRGVVVAGDTQPPIVHAVAAAMNDRLGSVGTSVLLLDTGEESYEPQALALQQLATDMANGQVDVLLTIGSNPVYHTSADLDFAAAMQRVNEAIHMGLYVDETAQVASWHIPATHYLEAWGDGRAYDGTLSLIQPLIAPLYESARSELEVLNLLASGSDLPGYDVVRATWQNQNLVAAPFEDSWRAILHDGFVPNTGFPTVTPGIAAVPFSEIPVGDSEELEVVFRLDPTVLDGSYANVAYLQEQPDPITKIVWDNVAAMSPRTAEQLGIEVEYDKGVHNTRLVELTVNGRTVTLPAWIIPGYPDGTIGVTLGYGRNISTTRSGRREIFFDKDDDTDIYGHGALANGVGMNVSPLRTPDMERVAVGARAQSTGERYTIVSTQEHWAMEGRPIIRMASLETFRENPNFAQGMGGPLGASPPLWENNIPFDEPEHKNSLHFENQWGMVIDTNACIGCGACMMACNMENNIPMVGKEEVGRGREMHWLRIDRYFIDDEEGEGEPYMEFQPMMCVHCLYAPCEPVCPVAATTHSADGLNEMTYNRCIGTRYCSNNCPYKVRRFNFYNWTKTMPLTVQMAMNPNVTVRFRGVMEKCTYCVQRIREVQRRVDIENRTIQDGEVQTACQSVCPTNAIVFGDLNDADSNVSWMKQNPRKYEVLETLNTQPRTSHLAAVRNLNPRLSNSAAL